MLLTTQRHRKILSSGNKAASINCSSRCSKTRKCKGTSGQGKHGRERKNSVPILADIASIFSQAWSCESCIHPTIQELEEWGENKLLGDRNGHDHPSVQDSDRGQDTVKMSQKRIRNPMSKCLCFCVSMIRIQKSNGEASPRFPGERC